MNYPIWNIYYTGGGLLIALISVVHVYVAHFAVGGGAFLVITEMKAHKEHSSLILEYVKRHCRFFLLLTAVFGSVTGVGIWFTISLFHPAATSILIHQFVFAWASEWVCFIGELIALFLYYYHFDSLKGKAHIKLGWLYFFFAYMSLFIINGIISFMLTPGEWLKTKNFWDAFFNPTFWPSLLFRTAMSFNFAGIFGYLTAAFINDTEFSHQMTRYCTKWLILPFALMGASLFWYIEALPEGPQSMILLKSPESWKYVQIFSFVFPALLIGCLLALLRFSKALKIGFSFLLIATGLAYIGGFEWIRESSRKPYIIYGSMYANAIPPDQEKEINEKGILKVARWTEHRTVTLSNRIAAGKRIFEIQCLSCHSINGPLNDIVQLTKHHTIFSMNAKLSSLGAATPYMPPFMGTSEERHALTSFIVEQIHGRDVQENNPVTLKRTPVAIPEFDEKNSEYVLLAWSEKGMKTISDAYGYLSFSLPGNTLMAQLIRRNELPNIVTKDVVLTYEVESDFKTPSRHTSFWKYGTQLTGKSIEKDKGILNTGMSGQMEWNPQINAFTAKEIPVYPYGDSNNVMPYPVVSITAKDTRENRIIATTKAVLPASTEWGCKNCHGGGYRVKNMAGMEDQTAENILKTHDRMNRTVLNQTRKEGSPVRCKECHSETENTPHLNFSAAIHGFHSLYLKNKKSESCHSCHPSSSDGTTQMMRGLHKSFGMDCVNCHGSLEDLSIGLLLNEEKEGKKNIDRLLMHIRSEKKSYNEDLSPRKPYIDLPDCLHCHIDFMPPDTDEIPLNKLASGSTRLYSQRVDESGLYCQACHGTAHAVYPSQNPYNISIENMQPLQYQKNMLPIGSNKNCRICHKSEMKDEMHHPNSLRLFRNLP